MLYSLLPFTVLYVAISGIEARSIHACPGESVRLFQNIFIKFAGTDTFLYKNSRLIELWSTSQDVQKEEKISFDECGNIWMNSVNVSDGAEYAVIQTMDETHPTYLYEVKLIVLVAPEKSCRPQLKRDGDTLIASLETGAACGNPLATTFWLDNPYLAVENQAMAKLSPGKEAGTYYACIETPALRCARQLKPLDFCSSLTIVESNYHTGSTATATAITTITVLCTALLFMAISNRFIYYVVN